MKAIIIYETVMTNSEKLAKKLNEKFVKCVTTFVIENYVQFLFKSYHIASCCD